MMNNPEPSAEAPMFDLETIRFALRALWENRPRYWDWERVRALQERRFRQFLPLVMEHSPFYRKKYRGIDPGHCSLADLPPTNKMELMADFDNVVTDHDIHRDDLERWVDNPDNATKLFLGRYPVCHTSGSQGQAMLIVQSPLTLELLFGFQLIRGNVSYQLGPLEAVRRALNPGRIAVTALKKGFYPSASVWEHMPPAVRNFVRVERLAPTDPDLIAKLNLYRPNVLVAYASVLENLLLDAPRLSLAPDLRQIVSNSETLSARSRTQLFEAFGVPILDNYSCGECAIVSTGCATDPGAHVNADWVILEVVDENYRPTPPGETGYKVLITHLANTVQPFIRYELNDRVAMATTPCHCGNQLPRIERIDGRTADFFLVDVDGAKRQLVGTLFKNAFDFLRDVREWQAIQVERNRIQILVEMLPGKRVDMARCRQMLDYQLDLMGARHAVALDVRVVPELRSDPVTGKFRRCISLVDNAPASPRPARDGPESAELRGFAAFSVDKRESAL